MVGSRGSKPIPPWLDLRWWMVVATALALAANTAVGTLAAATFLGIWVLHSAAWPGRVLHDLASVRLPWLYPVLAIVSVAWSQAAPISLRLGIQLLLTTMIGVLIARALPPGRLVTALLAALAVMCAASLAVGGNVAVGVSGETASIGLFGSKNYQASIGAVLIMVSLATLIGSGNPIVLRVVALAGLVLGSLTLLRSKSAGATATAAGAAMLLVAVVLLGRIPARWRGAIVAVVAIMALVGGAALVSIGAETQDALLGAFGKDAGLTGRSYLWYRAEDSISRDPILGVGYQAFWVKENVEAEGLWRYGFVQSRAGFHFHNLYYETTVELGFLGLAALLLTLVPTYACTWAWGLRSPDATSGFFLAYLTFTILRSFGEVELTFPFEFGPVLFGAAWVYSTSAARGARWQEARRPASQLGAMAGRPYRERVAGVNRHA
jgi:exopolysaccharide production protein ExoQ